MKIRSYKREFLDKVKQKFNDLQPGNKNNKDATRKPCNDKKREERDTKGMPKGGHRALHLPKHEMGGYSTGTDHHDCYKGK